ncbi:hypothetical protein [Parendozoicomonas sp. Alg238-R29]|uniref:hypothetical protein n=1 Tax=Parendozoicomonas sp. Alg238-R29 TaxID=2993446 RepID=UPI00248D3C33|nr:hypothetical protein [Parendozoicomonas sp. Alg238-R29]
MKQRCNLEFGCKVSIALGWITNYLSAESIPYLITGGLAARAYGSLRPVADIDIYVPAIFFKKVTEFGKEFIQWGPDRYRDDSWDLDLIELDYHGQSIEVCNAGDIQYFDTRTDMWVQQYTDFSEYESAELFGNKVRVMSKQKLVAYKSALGRDVDLSDIQSMNK